MIKHLLDIADGRQVLAEVLDSISDLALEAKWFDTSFVRSTDRQLGAQEEITIAYRVGATIFLGLVFAPPHPPL
jgi:hypothetical protein